MATARRKEKATPQQAADLGEPGVPFERRSPFYVGFFGALGALIAFWLCTQLLQLGSLIVLIVVALFLAAGLNPAVEFFCRRGMKRSWAVLAVISCVLLVIAGFVFALVPVIADQVRLITENAPQWVDQLAENPSLQELDKRFDVIDSVRQYVADSSFASDIFGGVVGVGVALLSGLLNGFIVVVLMLYFLASLEPTKQALYRLAPASRRNRVSRLGDQVLGTVGGYVSGAFVVSLCAGVSSLIFLFIVGLGEYALALSFVVALLSLIPMVGATIAMVIVSAIGFTLSPATGIVCLVFYALYQQVENYVIYPRVMKRYVNIPGSVTVIAAMFGGTLLGVVGALLAVPTAAALLMLTREIMIKRQDQC